MSVHAPPGEAENRDPLGNVLFPSLVKRNFPHRNGWIISLYPSLLEFALGFCFGLVMLLMGGTRQNFKTTDEL